MKHTSDPIPLELSHITFERGTKRILDDVTLRVQAGEHWLILGANGCGKTSLLRVAAMYEHPSSGTVRVLGEELGHTDVRQLRRQVGYSSAALASEFRTELTASDIVVTAKNAALEPWWHHYDDDDRSRAFQCLEQMGVDEFANRPLATLSSGEQQRVFLARTLMNDPGVILLDEPSARLDLGGREQLVGALSELANAPDGPPILLVTHHLDEVPAGITHVLLMSHGRSMAQGPLADTLTSKSLSECFEMPLQLERRKDGRLNVWVRH